MVDASRRFLNSPSPGNRTQNMAKMFRLFAAAGAAFLIPYMAAVVIEPGVPLWPACVVLGLGSGWWAGRQNQWESDPDFDPWEPGVPAHLRWQPLVSSGVVALLVGATAFAMGLDGARGEDRDASLVDQAVVPIDTITEPTPSSSEPDVVATAVGEPAGDEPAAGDVHTHDHTASQDPTVAVQEGSIVEAISPDNATGILVAYGWEQPSIVVDEQGDPIVLAFDAETSERVFLPAEVAAQAIAVVGSWATGGDITTRDGVAYPAPTGVTGMSIDNRTRPGLEVIDGGSSLPNAATPERLAVIVTPIYQCADSAEGCAAGIPMFVELVSIGSEYQVGALRGIETG